MADIENAGREAPRKTGWFGNRFFDNGVTGCVGHLGVPGAGKSFLMGMTGRRCSRVVFFDSNDTYGSGPRLTPLPGFLLATQPVQLKRFWEAHGGGGFRILYKPPVQRGMPDKKNGAYFVQHLQAVSALVFALKDTVLVVDEMWMFCGPSSLPDYLEDMTLRGRTPGITLLWAAQRASTVSRSLTAVTTELRVFRTIERLDLDALAGRVPPDALRILPTLPDRQFVSVDLGGNWKLCTSDQNGVISELPKK